MKILYLSCHSILEYDELRLFEELGIEYFSLGSYIDPQKPVDPIRPPLKQKAMAKPLSMAPERNKLTKEFVEPFDAIVVMHVPEWIEENWEQIKHKKVIWRTIGQSNPAIEKRLWKYRQEGLIIFRYSPKESNITDNIGCDQVVRFYKDPEEFKDWNGLNKEVITFAQNMKHRAEFCSWDAFVTVVSGFDARVYGPNNENAMGLNGGFLTYDQMKQKMRDSRVYVYTGTQPASYTLNFIEAQMTGIPIVALGPRYANSMQIAGDTYEIPDIMINASSGFWSDDLGACREYVQKLLDDMNLAKLIGQRGREVAIKYFGKETVKEIWRTSLDKYVTKT